MKKKTLNKLTLKKKSISNLSNQKQTGGGRFGDSKFICEYELTAATQCIPWGSCEGSQMECGGYC